MGTGAVPNMHCLAMKLMTKLKGLVGLDKCKYAFTGAAPIRVDTVEYFGTLGIYINEVYGMSESAGCVTMSTDQAHAWGSCGWQFPGSEVKCFKVTRAISTRRQSALSRQRWMQARRSIRERFAS